MNIANFASDVWTGMTKGVQKGKKFTTTGNKQAADALKRVRRQGNRKMTGSNTASNLAKDPKMRKLKVNNGAPIGQKIGNFIGGGMRDTYQNMSKYDMSFGDAFKQGHRKDGADRISKTKLAGTYIGASAVGRVATGGGIMKDKNGNTNVIGVPFI